MSPCLRWHWSPPAVFLPYPGGLCLQGFLLPPSCSRHSTATGLNTKCTRIFKSKCTSAALFLSAPSFLHSLGIESCKCSAFQTILPSWTVRTKPISASSVRDTSDLYLGKQGGSSRFRRVCIDILS